MQTNHIHLIVEAESNELLTRGMRSLTITFAKGLKKGKVQLERYHLHVLRTLRETKNAVLYVLFNQQKHENAKQSTIDEYSSLLHMERGLEIIRRFAGSAGITLKLTKSDSWRLEKGRSYLLQKSLEAIC